PPGSSTAEPPSAESSEESEQATKAREEAATAPMTAAERLKLRITGKPFRLKFREVLIVRTHAYPCVAYPLFSDFFKSFKSFKQPNLRRLCSRVANLSGAG